MCGNENNNCEESKVFVGFTPVLVTESVGSGCFVFKIINWIGGSGKKPAINLYLGVSGYVVNKSDANVICPNGGSPDVPQIQNFALNTTVNVAQQTITFNQASFVTQNPELFEPNSMRIEYVTGGTTIATGLSLSSPVTIPAQSIQTVSGNTYRWRAVARGLDGNDYLSNVYSVQASAPGASNSMYWGNTNVTPQQFQDMTVEQIFALGGQTEKVITGSQNNLFEISQTQIIHYLLIPNTEVDLELSEYGDALVSTLWNKATQSGAYFPRGTVKLGMYNSKEYRVFFLYNPSGGFPEKIRITCKNK